MSQLTRFFHKIFGVSADFPTEMGVYGSLKAGSPTFATDLSTIQSLPAWVGGIDDALIGADSPCKEDFNSIFHHSSYQLGYIFQAGIPEYDEQTEYYTNSFCRVGNLIYTSATDINTGNTVTDTSYWRQNLRGVTTDTTNYTMLPTDDFIQITTGATTTVTMLDPAAIPGKKITIKNFGTFPLIALGSIDTDSSDILVYQNDSKTYVSDGTVWNTIGRPAKDDVYAHFQNTASSTPNSTFANIPFPTEKADSHNGWNSSTHEYTFPRSGILDIFTTITPTTDTYNANEGIQFKIVIGGVDVAYNTDLAWTGIARIVPSMSLGLAGFPVKAGETMQIQYKNDAGAGASLANEAGKNYFSLRIR